MPLKVVTLHHPWGVLIEEGLKTNETRSWGTDYRGLIAIHTAIKNDDETRAAITHFTRLFPKYAAKILRNPAGLITCVADLADCWSTDDLIRVRLLSKTERECGDYSPKRWVWVLKSVRPLRWPVSWRGLQKLKDLKGESLTGVIKALPIPAGHSANEVTGVFCTLHRERVFHCQACQRAWSPCCGELPHHV